MSTPMSARIAAATSGAIDGEVSPGIEPAGIDVSGASVVLVASVDDVTFDGALVEDWGGVA